MSKLANRCCWMGCHEPATRSASREGSSYIYCDEHPSDAAAAGLTFEPWPPVATEGKRVTMRCANESEEGWPEREFTPLKFGDHRCTVCDWCQLSFAEGCREIVTSVEWHDPDALLRHINAALDGGLAIEGTVQLYIPKREAE